MLLKNEKNNKFHRNAKHLFWVNSGCRVTFRVRYDGKQFITNLLPYLFIIHHCSVIITLHYWMHLHDDDDDDIDEDEEKEDDDGDDS